MEIQIPESKREIAGLVAIALGGILSVCAGINLGKKVEYFSKSLQSKYEVAYDEDEGSKVKVNPEEMEKEADYVKRNIYLGMAGLALLGGGSLAAFLSSRRFEL